MSQFTIPQFIEKEAKVIGPFTFKQFIYIGGAGTVLFFLFFLVPFTYFILAAIILLPLSLALAVLKIDGISLPVVLKNFFLQTISPKIYVWKKTPLIKKVPKMEKETLKETPQEKAEVLPLKITEKSRLKKLMTELETRIK